MSLEVQNLYKQYGEQWAVNDVSFTVGEGEIVGFLGPNGAGKSTTMKIATCYLPPTAGTVRINGLDVLEHPLRVRQQLGYLPEHNPLYLDMYVHEYLRFIGSVHKLSGKRLKQRVGEVVALCGLEREQNKKIQALSKGYRQRVGLAQALVHDPSVLILDEPTTGLDPNQIEEIRGVIRSISARKTVVFSTHIMQEVQALCQRVVIINRGRVVADSPVSRLQQQPAGGRLIRVEFEAPINPELFARLEGIRQVEEAGASQYLLHTTDDLQVRSRIFRLAADNDLPLVGLRLEENSLENVFRELTQQQPSEA
ncbi:gliding motility-associated ABC transporter ATP-binding subunit GldA [Cesiribacter andamanensis]|uniref:Putative ABC transporter ATP-binding protein YbhF n=1 Tax=Cesiribacter andamanensis AMV16 TaxID=1279009 RepID=M7N8G5_9BACT|nr:gliding motility-associated ABC transporter ATP-binding subunit GldA [Cesiribacter andamanensis]EMR03557.1 putative ABC transporter ATP-binding protein YbhF [Cesiribacter andamanensis AMV16]